MYTKKQGRDGVARPQRLGRTLTPTRPYPTRLSRERLAVSGWRLGTHLFQLPFERRRTASGLRSRLIGYQVRVFWFGYGHGPEPVPAPEYLNLGPDGRDPGPENVFRNAISICALQLPATRHLEMRSHK